MLALLRVIARGIVVIVKYLQRLAFVFWICYNTFNLFIQTIFCGSRYEEIFAAILFDLRLFYMLWSLLVHGRVCRREQSKQRASHHVR